MKHRRILPLVLIIALLFSLCIPAVAEDDRTITVSGSATISLLADTATIEIGVETTSQDVAEAQQQNTYEMNRVIEALKKAGREDLIGWEKSCLIPPYLREKKKGNAEQTKAKNMPAQKKTERRNEKPAKYNNRNGSVSKKETRFGKKKHGR